MDLDILEFLKHRYLRGRKNQNPGPKSFNAVVNSGRMRNIIEVTVIEIDLHSIRNAVVADVGIIVVVIVRLCLLCTKL
jgi:hypothetical protein